MRRKAKHWTLQLSPAIHPTPHTLPWKYTDGYIWELERDIPVLLASTVPPPPPPPKFALERSSVNYHVSKATTFCVTIFQSTAMFSCQFAKVAILDHYDPKGSRDEIAEYFKV